MELNCVALYCMALFYIVLYGIVLYCLQKLCFVEVHSILLLVIYCLRQCHPTYLYGPFESWGGFTRLFQISLRATRHELGCAGLRCEFDSIVLKYLLCIMYNTIQYKSNL